MEAPRYVAVIDIGKTNAKLALVDRTRLTEVAVLTRPNRVLSGSPWPHFDTEGLWRFIRDGLARLHADHGVDAIAVTTHGAAAAWLTPAGDLAAPVLDYEHDGPDSIAADYDALRPPFAETGSPRLPLGLNLGAQLHWQMRQDAGLAARSARLVTYPQYWGARLTGIAACDVASLGCHTDLWAPGARSFSSLVQRLGLAGHIAPPLLPGAVLGPILPAVAAETGLDPATPVVCGIHDSNASLLPHLLARQPPFSVVSTGTWVIAMSVGGGIGGAPAALDPARDTLINVSALSDPVPSARFMGGREYEVLRHGRRVTPTQADLAAVLDRQAMLFPAIETASGPFAGRASARTHTPEELGEAGDEAVVSFYLALMTAECLSLTAAAGEIIVEGPFAANDAYLAMLAAVTDRPVLKSEARTGTSLGAALLFPGPALPPPLVPVAEPPLRDAMVRYAAAWQAALRNP